MSILRRYASLFLCLGLIAIGVARIVSCYSIFNQTNDEQAHLAAGMQLLDQHRYDYETLHPPLARLMIAALPYLEGLSPTQKEYAAHQDILGMWKIGNNILYKNHNYFHNLTLARMGILPFYVIAVLTLWFWSVKFYNKTVAISATLLFSTLPVILAHSMVATTDMAVTSMLSLAIFTALLWLQYPSCKRSIWLGITAGLALLTKLSALIFLPICIKAIAWYKNYAVPDIPEVPLKEKLQRAALIGGFLCITVWSGYLFVNFPAYLGFERLIDGFDSLLYKQTHGHMLFFNGKVNNHQWYYFLVLLAIKTPIAFQLLTFAGIYALLTGPIRNKEWEKAAPLLVAILILVITSASRINMGLRHILPIYPFLSLIAGYGGFYLWEKRHLYLKVTVCLLLLWHTGASLLSHPYYLGYFNEAVKHPENITLDSDLDWGQDLYLLVKELEKRQVKLNYFYYLGWAEPGYFGLPANQCNLPYATPSVPPERPGWYATSLACLKITNVKDLSWLEKHKPVAKIGTSILLYHVE